MQTIPFDRLQLVLCLCVLLVTILNCGIEASSAQPASRDQSTSHDLSTSETEPTSHDQEAAHKEEEEHEEEENDEEDEDDDDEEKVPEFDKRILVFGGNGFIGSETVARLIEENYQIGIVNRGNWYWDSALRIKPHVTHFRCDRMWPLDLQYCPQLTLYVANNDPFDVVIDFSGHFAGQVEHTVQLLEDNKVKLYIYISSHEIYDVCDKKHTHHTREDDDHRLEDLVQATIRHTAHFDSHQRLEAEEEVQYQSRKHKFRYIALRLPDVFGPRDTTGRFWFYYLWLKLAPYLDTKPSVPKKLLNQSTSLAYVNDVAKLIARLVKNPKPEAYDRSFNIAQRETPTLLEFLEELKAVLNVTDLEIGQNGEEKFHKLPSSHTGPLDIDKAVRFFGWTPTPFKQAVRETVAFMEEVMKSPPGSPWDRKKRDLVEMMASSGLVRDPSKVYAAVQELYGTTFGKDEL